MAQYYQVLSQGDKNAVEEIGQFYPNIIENQTVQYVLNPEEQQFPTQQILLSSDQVMVIENPGQHVIVDQSAVTYQNPQYLIQDNSVEYQNTNQPIYFMEEVEGNRQIQEEQMPQTQQPLVLNHQLPTSIRNQININNTSPKPRATQALHQVQQPRPSQTQSTVRHVLQTTRPQTHQPHSQIVLQRPMIAQPTRQPHQVQQTPQIPRNVASQQALHQLPPQQKTTNQTTEINTCHNSTVPSSLQRIPEIPPLYAQHESSSTEITERDSQQSVTLGDGTVMVLSEYKKLLAETKQQRLAAEQEELDVPSLPKYKSEPSKFRGRRVNRGGRSPRKNVSQPNTTNHSASFVSQDNSTTNIQQRFLAQQMKHLNQSQSKQCVQPQQYNHQQIMQQSQTSSRQHQSQPQQPQYVQPQYIIQPPSQHQPQQHCPLPAFVAPSQIQQIIENTPVSEEHSDSIRMLVLLENCEQRLITFTLPKEPCTIQEILEQVGVPFYPETKIECTETNNFGINYLVTVGVQNHDSSNSSQEIDSQDINSSPSDTSTACETGKPLSPEQSIDAETPQYVPGFLAVCNHCGYTSENFRRCLRCRFKLPEDVKTRPVLNNNGTNGKKTDVLKSGQNLQDKKLSPRNCSFGNSKFSNTANKKKRSKVIDPEPVVLTLSSDDEDASSSKLSDADELIRKLSNSSVTLSAIKKEPTTNDIKHNISCDNESSYAAKGGGKDETIDSPDLEATLYCRTVRIGSYKYFPPEDIIVKSLGLTLKVPMPSDSEEIKTIDIDKKNIVKVLVNFNKSLPVIFYYVIPSVGQYIREQLGMVDGNDTYFDPLSEEESYRRITLILHSIPESTKTVIRSIYSKPNNIMDELTSSEANDILIKTCPKELSKVIASSGYTEIKQLFIYPPGKGGLSVNTEDYLCLAQDQFLNDVIIDFYLKYLVLNLPEVIQRKVHVFSTFFYKRLTTKPLKASRRSHPSEVDPNLTPAQKRHARVEKWTKSVNLFEKDFIIIPINENCHWFLAIVCFPGMNGCITWDGNPIKVEPKQKKKKNTSTIGNVTITTLNQDKDQTLTFDDPDASDKDEAEGDESELDSDVDSDEQETTESTPTEPPVFLKRQPIKQASILIFDSLAGASRARVVATLRDYLTCEYKAKMGVEKLFNKDVIKGSCPKVPQQTNFTDCGLYLLQYVEQFFKDPIKDYHVPIKEVKDWFDEFVVTRKREDISVLIKELMLSYNKDPSTLPVISFPTHNGKLVQHEEDEDEEFMNDEFDEEDEDEDEFLQEDSEISDSLNESSEQQDQIEEETPAAVSTTTTGPIRINLNQNNRREEKVSVKLNEGFVEEAISEAFLKPDMSETVNHNSRDTLSYLKAKRINRHKNVSLSDNKRFKTSD